MNETKNFLTLKDRLEADLLDLFTKFNEYHIKVDGAKAYEEKSPINQLHAGDILAFYWTHFKDVEKIGRLNNRELVMLLQLIEDSPFRSEKDQPLVVNLENDDVNCDEAEYVRQRLRTYEQ